MTKRFEKFTYEIEKYFYNVGESHVMTFQYGNDTFEIAKNWGKDELKSFTNDDVTLRIYDENGKILYTEIQDNYYKDTVTTIEKAVI